MAKENVNHPDHYNTGKYEVIDVIEDQGWGEGFNKGNAIKYIMRAKHKNSDKEIEDLEKARWYIDREIQRLRAKDNKWFSVKEINNILGYKDEEVERIFENGKEIQ